MTILKFIVDKQLLTQGEEEFVVSDSREILQVEFDFSIEWENFIKTVVFGTAFGEKFSVNLEGKNSCIVPWEVIAPPFFTVSVYGTNQNQRITTNKISINVTPSGYEQGKTPEPPTPTVYESLLAEIDTLNRDFENLGTASGYDVGTDPGNLPVINEQGKLEKEIIPQVESEETDPIFTASPAYSIKESDIEKWNSNSGFSGDYNDLINKPQIPTNLSELQGILPVSQGGTGADNPVGSLANLQIFTDVSQLGLSYPTTTNDIVEAIPAGSLGFFSYDSKSTSIKNAPVSYGIFSVFYPRDNDRPFLLCSQCISTGNDYGAFYVGYYETAPPKSIKWYRIFNGSMITTVSQGGTGANTADKALENLGAASAANVGDVSSLLTAEKTVVGAINELYNMINLGG